MLSALLRLWNLARMGHVLRTQNAIESFFRKPALLQREFIDAAACLQGHFGNGRRFPIAKHWVQRGHQADTVLHILPVAITIGLDSNDATAGEDNSGILEDHKAMDQVIDENGHGRIEFKLTNLRSKGNHC
jgi:hypothetical protein